MTKTNETWKTWVSVRPALLKKLQAAAKADGTTAEALAEQALRLALTLRRGLALRRARRSASA